ncbi:MULTISPECIES: c-type cytochrome [Methylocaldum]|jgi:cytochrome c2|uniref:c-type cytochrome n=1 Tax=unclassified Methylocaldum TaxID=2622260 RepID=UPI00098A311E|nr:MULTISPECIES: c-type cytochrome [unclassified Methylocaldum]MBP1150350.1 cytochrome c2 [Methylocaldum sp. RMAD-M]MVF23276.1 c-type cytochrome [Methylocaldum sp. BRCS4]
MEIGHKLSALACAIAAVLLLNACDRQEDPAAVSVAGGDPAQGREAISRYGCGSCHVIPGIEGANGLVGPPLSGIASRVYIAGVLTNTPENLMRWIQDPPAIDPLTAMPNTGVTEADARHLASFLYTLR